MQNRFQRRIHDLQSLAVIASLLALSACSKPDEQKKVAEATPEHKQVVDVPRYVIRGSLAYDKTTNLTWQRCSFGMQWSPNTEGPYVGCINIAKALSFENAQQTGDGQWRVPTETELESLLFPTPTQQVDTDTFPDLKGRLMNIYWTSTTRSEVSFRNGKSQSDRWGVDVNFKLGAASVEDPRLKLLRLVRLVRSGDWSASSP